MMMYMMNPISSFVVIAANSGSVLAMCWNVGKMLESTTFTASPPQYACMPKLLAVSNYAVAGDGNFSLNEVDETFQHDHKV